MSLFPSPVPLPPRRGAEGGEKKASDVVREKGERRVPKAGGRGGAAREPRVPAAAHTCRDVRTNEAVWTKRGRWTCHQVV